MKLSKNTVFILKAIVSVAILVLLFSVIDWKRLLSLFRQTNIVYALLVIGVVWIDRAFMAFKWRLLVQALGIRVPFIECLRVYFIATFIGMVFPAGVGAGDIVRLFAVDTDKGKREEIAASIVVERFVAVIALMLLFLIASIFLLHYSIEGTKWLSMTALILLAGTLACFIISLYRLPTEKLKRFDKGLMGKLRKVVDSYQVFRNRKRTLLIFFLLSFLEHLLPVLANYLIACALDIDVNALSFFVIIPVIMIVTRLPIPLMNWPGLQEALYFFLFQMAGLSKTDSLSIGLLSRFLMTIAVLPGGWLFLSVKRKSPGE